jgi:hypothetical protein
MRQAIIGGSRDVSRPIKNAGRTSGRHLPKEGRYLLTETKVHEYIRTYRQSILNIKRRQQLILTPSVAVGSRVVARYGGGCD